MKLVPVDHDPFAVDSASQKLTPVDHDPFAEPKTDFSALEMAKNIPGSAVQFGKDLVHPFVHPVDTAKAVGKMALGGIDKGAEALVEALPDGVVEQVNQFNNQLANMGVPLARLPESKDDMTFPNAQYADQIADFIKSRYGSVDEFKKTAMNDPVGVLADAALVMTGAGGAVRAGSKATGNIVQKVGMAADPVNLVTNTAKGAVAKVIPKDLPANWYEGAAKFGTTIPQKQRAQMIQTALDEGVIPSSSGVDKLKDKINAVELSLDEAIKQATAQGKSVPKGAVFRHLKELRQDKGGPLLEALADLRHIDRTAKSFDLNLKRLNKSDLNPNELQKLKRDTYSKINWDAKHSTGTPIKEDTYKAMARGAKDSLAELVPEVIPANAKLGPMLELQPHLQRAANRVENLNLLPLGIPLNAGAGTAVGGMPGGLMGTLAAVLDTPKAKSTAAIKLNAMQKRALLAELLMNSPRATLAKQGLYQAGRAEEEIGP